MAFGSGGSRGGDGDMELEELGCPKSTSRPGGPRLWTLDIEGVEAAVPVVS